MTKGQRTIDGQVYVLGGRAAGLNAKVVAQSEACAHANELLMNQKSGWRLVQRDALN
jgi:hypothetical protein